MSETSTEQTRVFVSGLPRNLTSEQLAAHFRDKYSVTDAHVFPERRIGFIGFHDNTTAQDAVKYFDRSYIRMSKISVDLARPIEVKSDINGQAIPVSQRGSNKRQSGRIDRARSPSTKNEIPSATLDEHSHETKKRKRDTRDDGEAARSEADAASHVYGQTSMPTPPLDESQDGYFNGTIDTKGQGQDLEQSQPASDMDWLRGKTSRVLDLLQPEEALPVTIKDDESSHSDSSAVENGNLDMPAEKNGIETDAESETQPRVPNARLFIRNLAFDVTEDDLRSKFDVFGKIQEMHVVVDTRKSTSKGMAFIQYSDKFHAEEALKTMDGVAFHGRLLHILPAADKRDTGLTEFDISKMPLKKQKAIRRKMDAASATFSWNSMYMNPDAVIASVANRLGVSKSDILDPTSSDAAVKQAHAETQIIAETKDYLKANGVNVEAFKNQSRDDRTVLLKNFSFGTHETELRDLLEPHGQLTQFLMPPAGTMALAQFAEPHSASQALKVLSYKNVKGTVLYLEKAPSGLLNESVSIVPQQTATVEHLDKKVGEDISSRSGVPVAVFIRNLSFKTTTTKLTEVFSPLAGFLSARVKTRTDPKRPTEILSMGFGFVEFASKPHAEAGISAMNGYRLDGHELIVKMSTKSTDIAEERRAADAGKRQTADKTKIVIKNLPFQATKKDVRTLFAQYGQLKSVRVPKKFDNTSRGFAFAEFVTAKEASNALEALTDTHLLGRRLVLDFVEEEAVDAEEQIKAIEKKVEQQSSRINLSKLISTGRKKFNVGGTEDDFAA